jgi:catalase
MEIFTEYPEENELKYYEKIASLAKQQMDELYGHSSKEAAKRDTHAKTHGGVKGTLEIFDFDEGDIKKELVQNTALTENQLNPISLKQGLLATPKQYPVWLRFANGRSEVKNDYESDARSMSVKIIGVNGERLSESHESQMQDIITQNADIFFIKTIHDYHGFFKAVMNSRQPPFYKLSPLIWLLLHPQQFSALRTVTQRFPHSLLTESYWSGSAYALGLPPNFDPCQMGLIHQTYPAVIKYKFTPVAADPPHQILPEKSRSQAQIEQAKTENTEDNYYRHQLIEALAKPEAKYCWDFQIQFQTLPQMSIDDVTIPWNEAESPFLTVGRLTVQHQMIHSPQQDEFAENLRFSPWNGLAVHRPVGALNRLRQMIYPIVAEYRHQKRQVNYCEPTGEETF